MTCRAFYKKRIKWGVGIKLGGEENGRGAYSNKGAYLLEFIRSLFEGALIY
jgi:hypothetical protein